MSDTKNLLVELFVEELPPKALNKLGDAFANDIFTHLRKLDFLEVDSVKTAFASPRRIAVHVTDVRVCCRDVPIRKKLVPVQVAFNEQGEPTDALLKRLEKEEATLADTKRAFEDGKEFIWLERVAPGRPLSDILEQIVLAAISNLPIPKVMSYQLADGWSTVHFVRPAHGLVALHGTDIVPITILGLTAGRETHGHRFEAAVDPVLLPDADCYAQKLATDGAVIASFAARRAEIVRQLTAAAATAGTTPIDDDALLDEVTALVERPNVLTGQFEEEYLAVPQECLILTMKANQKYFPLLDAAGKLTNKFLVVSNIRPADPKAVIGGNERVVRPRLADAKFFFDQDRKKPLEARVLGLAKVVYHNKLGTQGERVQRVSAIARTIGAQVGGELLSNQADQAALLAKADLLTDMVGEFPELQGTMGRYYALHDGLPGDVADAIEDHYKPRFAGDTLPRGQVGLVLALADKLETLVGMFGIGQVPTGDRDPFALRRHALGAIRILIEGGINLPLDQLLASAAAAFPLDGGFRQALPQLTEFIYDRLSGNLREQGYTPQEVDAVVSQRPKRLGDIAKRLAAVRAFASLPEAAALAAANKRIVNILKKSEGAADKVDVNLLEVDAERILFRQVNDLSPQVRSLMFNEDYTGALKALAGLRAAVDTFFDEVMVNAEDPAIRANRLALLAQLAGLLNGVADISKL